MGESFQDYSWIQDFEADFPQKVSTESQPQNPELKWILIASDLFSVHLWATDHLNLKLLTLCRHTAASFKTWISKVQDFLKFWTFTHADAVFILVTNVCTWSWWWFHVCKFQVLKPTRLSWMQCLIYLIEGIEIL